MPDYAYAWIGIPLIFLATTLGSAFVFFLRAKDIPERLNRVFVGFAAGIMLSASFFSLIKPALETKDTPMPVWIIAAISILCGALLLWGLDKTIPHFHAQENKEEGIESKSLSKTAKMFLAVTLHNVPEGLTVGIAFGVALSSRDPLLLSGALLLSIGIAIQNIPEGAVVSLPIKAEKGSSLKAFLFGTASGAVEPIAALFGLVLAMQIQGIMPWALCFAAGAMIYVVAEEMIPELKSEDHDHYGVWSFVIGFVLMMVLDCLPL